jgi:hypothetical protein
MGCITGALVPTLTQQWHLAKPSGSSRLPAESPMQTWASADVAAAAELALAQRHPVRLQVIDRLIEASPNVSPDRVILGEA